MQSVILFDGVCNLCNTFVQFVIRNDKKERFLFASLQSDFAKRELPFFSIDTQEMTTVILLKDGKAYSKSTAALKIMKKLDGLWPLMYGLIIFPAFLRNFIYNLISRNRYKWFGKKDSCMIPSEALQRRFLS